MGAARSMTPCKLTKGTCPTTGREVAVYTMKGTA